MRHPLRPYRDEVCPLPEESKSNAEQNILTVSAQQMYTKKDRLGFTRTIPRLTRRAYFYLEAE
jgi:hypothetical protein